MEVWHANYIITSESQYCGYELDNWGNRD